MLKRIALEMMAYGAQYMGINAGLRAYQRDSLLVLCYHSVIPDGMASHPLLYGNAVTVSEFDRQMRLLTHYYHPISADQIPNWMTGTKDGGRKSVMITFDDGYRNNLTCAFPILKRLGIPALLFVSTGFVGHSRIPCADEIYTHVLHWPHNFIPVPSCGPDQELGESRQQRVAVASAVRECCKRIPHEECVKYLDILRKDEPIKVETEAADILRFLTWDEIREMKTNGFEIGSHTVDHPILTQIGPERLAQELTESKRVIEEQLDCPCSYFAYPNGGPHDVSASVTTAVSRAGYKFAFTVTDQLNCGGTNPLLLDRVFIPAGISEVAFYSRISAVHGRVVHHMTRRTLLRDCAKQTPIPIKNESTLRSTS